MEQKKLCALFQRIAPTLGSCPFSYLGNLCKVRLNDAARRGSSVFGNGK